MKKYIKHSIFGVILALSLSACMKDLDQEPIDPDSFTEKDVFKNATEAKGALAKNLCLIIAYWAKRSCG